MQQHNMDARKITTLNAAQYTSTGAVRQPMRDSKISVATSLPKQEPCKQYATRVKIQDSATSLPKQCHRMTPM
eukprot:4001978-Alexandrium_andersonii.AAC.1